MPVTSLQLGALRGRICVLSYRLLGYQSLLGWWSAPIGQSQTRAGNCLGIMWAKLCWGDIAAVSLGEREVGSLCFDSILQVSLMQSQILRGHKILWSGQTALFIVPWSVTFVHLCQARLFLHSYLNPTIISVPRAKLSSNNLHEAIGDNSGSMIPLSLSSLMLGPPSIWGESREPW